MFKHLPFVRYSKFGRGGSAGFCYEISIGNTESGNAEFQNLLYPLVICLIKNVKIIQVDPYSSLEIVVGYHLGVTRVNWHVCTNCGSIS